MTKRETFGRTGTQRAVRASRDSAWTKAEKHGLDMAIIENNLRKSPLERIMQHEQARHTFMMLAAAGRNMNDR